MVGNGPRNVVGEQIKMMLFWSVLDEPKDEEEEEEEIKTVRSVVGKVQKTEGKKNFFLKMYNL